MDSKFSFLMLEERDLLTEVLERRRPDLIGRIGRQGSISREDAEEIMTVLSDELNDNLDEDWEPTQRGRAVSATLAHFNAARLAVWP